MLVVGLIVRSVSSSVVLKTTWGHVEIDVVAVTKRHNMVDAQRQGESVEAILKIRVPEICVQTWTPSMYRHEAGLNHFATVAVVAVSGIEFVLPTVA